LPLNDFGIPPFDFLEAVQRLFDGPVCQWIKCKGFLDGNQLVIRAELPGVDPEIGIKVSFSGGVQLRELRRSRALLQKRRCGITASYKDGVLEVRVPGKLATNLTTHAISRSQQRCQPR
jgi:HSP20 family protein